MFYESVMIVKPVMIAPRRVTVTQGRDTEPPVGGGCEGGTIFCSSTAVVVWWTVPKHHLLAFGGKSLLNFVLWAGAEQNQAMVKKK